jgi:fatty acid desaturase
MWKQRFAAMGYLSIFVLPVLLVLGAYIGEPALAMGTALIAYPAARAVFGSYRRPPVWREGLASLLHALPLLYALALLGAVALLLLTLKIETSATALDRLGLGGSLALTLLFATCPAHELLHRREVRHARVGAWLAGLAGYPCLCIEHRHHHSFAPSLSATESPQWDESVWTFSARRIAAVAREVNQLCGLSAGPSRTALVARHAREAFLVTAISWALFTACAGWVGFLLYAFAVLIVTLGMQVMTYIQHWGLAADSITDARPQMAWEDDCQFQAWVTLHISFHQSHHRQPTLPFYRLGMAADAPRLPAGYIVLIVVCLIPSIWRLLMRPAMDYWVRQPLKPLSSGHRLSCFHVYPAAPSDQARHDL